MAVKVGVKVSPDCGDLGGRHGAFPERIITGLNVLNADVEQGCQRCQRFLKCCWRLAPISGFNSLLWTNSGHLSKASNQANQGTQ